jgi:hypothetical protein
MIGWSHSSPPVEERAFSGVPLEAEALASAMETSVPPPMVSMGGVGWEVASPCPSWTAGEGGRPSKELREGSPLDDVLSLRRERCGLKIDNQTD